MENDVRLENYDEEKVDWSKYLVTLQRRRWWFALPAFMIWAVVWGVSWMLPAKYRSETVIIVEQQKVPEQYVVANIGDDLQQRLQSMSQQILSRTRLLRIIEQFHLYSDRHVSANADEVVDALRKDIQIELVESRGRSDLSAFKIAYLSQDPKMARDVVSQLSSLFIEENLKARQQQSEDTTEFLDSQLEQARTGLATQEVKVREFKSQYLGELPGQVQANVQILSGLQTRRQQEMDALGQAKQQNVYLESMLNQLRAAEADVRMGRNSSSQAPQSLDAEIDRMQIQLAELTSRYSDEHPDVRKLRTQLAKAHKARQQREAEVDSGPKSDGPQKNPPRPTSYTDLQTMAPHLQVESQLKANRLEIENRQRNILEVERQINSYQARLNTSPLREQQLADLTRDYDQSRKNYEQLLAKRNQSEMATNLEIRQQGERFRVIDPANLPQKPYSPDRFKLALMGLAAGVLVGFVSIVGSEMMDDAVYSNDDLREIVAAPILVELPPLSTPWEVQRQARSNSLQRLGLLALGAMTIAGLGFNRFFG
jgi:polysaccharide biosynthesis transport protein